MLFKQETLTNVATEIMTKAGAPRENARIVAEHLVIANLKGHDSHGVGMVPNYVKAMLDGLMKPAQSAQLIKDSGAVVSYDGDTGFGRIVGMQAMEEGVIRAKKHGISCVALGNAHHLGGSEFMPNTAQTKGWSQVTMLTWWVTTLWLFLLGVETPDSSLILSVVPSHDLMVNTLCSIWPPLQ